MNVTDPAAPLVVAIEHVHAIEVAIRTAHEGLLEQARGALIDTGRVLTEWSETTSSRQAQQDFQQELGQRVDQLADRLLAALGDR